MLASSQQKHKKDQDKIRELEVTLAIKVSELAELGEVQKENKALCREMATIQKHQQVLTKRNAQLETAWKGAERKVAEMESMYRREQQRAQELAEQLSVMDILAEEEHHAGVVAAAREGQNGETESKARQEPDLTAKDVNALLDHGDQMQRMVEELQGQLGKKHEACEEAIALADVLQKKLAEKENECMEAVALAETCTLKLEQTVQERVALEAEIRELKAQSVISPTAPKATSMALTASTTSTTSTTSGQGALVEAAATSPTSTLPTSAGPCCQCTVKDKAAKKALQENKTMREEISKMQDTLFASEEEINRLKIAADKSEQLKLAAGKAEKDAAGYRASLQKVEKSAAEYRVSLEKAEENAATCRASLEKAEQDVATSQASLAHAEEIIEDLTETVRQVASKASAAKFEKQELEAMWKEEKEGLQAQLLAASHQASSDRLAELQPDNKDWGNMTWEQKFHSLQQQYQNLKASKAQRMTKLSQQVRHLKASQQFLSQQLLVRGDEIKLLRQRLSSRSPANTSSTAGKANLKAKAVAIERNAKDGNGNSHQVGQRSSSCASSSVLTGRLARAGHQVPLEHQRAPALMPPTAFGKLT